MDTLILYLSLALFTLGCMHRVSAWFTRDVWYLSRSGSGGVGPLARLKVFAKGAMGLGRGRVLVQVAWQCLAHGVMQVQVLKSNRFRWFMHMLIFAGFMGLTLMHAFEETISERFFPDYYATLNPYFFLRDAFGLLVLAGLAMAVARRVMMRRKGLFSNGMDYGAIGILAVIVLSGMFLEAVKISSHTVFENMVDEFGMIEDEKDVAALEAYWGHEFGVAIPGAGKALDPSLLEQGQAIHEESCMSCHADSRWAVAGYPLATGLGTETALRLDRAGAVTFFWWVHYVSCFLFLAWLPYGKMFHMFSTPMGLIVNSVTGKKGGKEALAIRRSLALDACTRCGTCSQYCSVRPAYEITGNPLVLPSEKLSFFKSRAGQKELSGDDFSRARQGVTLCTDCGNCARVCTAGIDLRNLWQHMKGDLLQSGKSDPMFLSPLAFGSCLEGDGVDSDQLAPAMKRLSGRFDDLSDPSRVIHVGQEPATQPFASFGIDACFQCGGCSSVCPVAEAVDDPQQSLGLLPHQVVQALKLGEVEMAEGAPMLWNCLTCYVCQESCPQGVLVTDLFYELKNRAYRRTGEGRRLASGHRTGSGR
ncbi:4Fe-4S dicluster domain-containing protein [Desulfoluna spongiiphila]|uniref:4Fe-4S dicluster domain-containing protein n=1 Tax=Desulfoluna spongiiphila TaxID=419481 RepID=UPI0012523E6B|nr:4Fe-4S dicluster domain-containing protein [Desulfoluna spongiiphila]VVS94417.1 alpha-helical ferredoxin [Desulfoluna spongiiphila]